MSEGSLTKEQLLRAFADAYERIIAAAILAAQRGATPNQDGWGPREIITHLAGWEQIASVRVPAIAGGMAPIEFGDTAQDDVMNNALNGAFVALVGDQSLAAVCALLRQTYRQNLAWLGTLDDTFFQPGEYVYERTKSVIEHCQEHSQANMSTNARRASSSTARNTARRSFLLALCEVKNVIAAQP